MSTGVAADSSGSDSGSSGGDTVDAMCPAGDLDPDPVWPVGDPSDFGVDDAALDAAAQYSAENQTRCLLVVRGGHLLYEGYWEGTEPDTRVKSYSIAKSYASTLVGLALAQGILGSVDDPIADYLPAAPADATLRDLLTMTSGVYGGVLQDYVFLNFAQDQTQFALETAQGEPAGAAWQYSNAGVQLLEPILREHTGMEVDAYAEAELWGPLGIDAQWDKDGAGHPLTYQNVRASCRDHAKFGLLYLHRGCWRGERIVEESWVDAATSSSQDLNRGYGYLFWVTGQVPTFSAVNFDEIEGGRHPFAPDGTYLARGLAGQMIAVVPELDMVVVRTGVAPQDDPQAWLDPLGLIDALINGSGEDVAGTTLEMLLGGVDP